MKANIVTLVQLAIDGVCGCGLGVGGAQASDHGSGSGRIETHVSSGAFVDRDV